MKKNEVISKKHPLVSVIMLNWNGLEDTQECLETLRKIDYPNFEIIIVDNGSADGSKEWLKQQNDIVMVDLDYNHGVTGGHNKGYEVAKGEFIANLNNDSTVDKHWLTALVEPMLNDPQIATTGGRAYLWSDEYPDLSTSNPFYSYQVVDPRGGYAQTLMVGDEVVEINSISTVGALMRRSAIEKTGYFDNYYFAYYDETDLFARFKRAGYKIVYTPHAMLWHKIGASTKSVPYFYLFQMHRNRFIFGIKNFDRNYLLPFILIYIKTFLVALRHYRHSRHIDDKAKINAFFWNLIRVPKTFWKRREVMKLGPTYSELLYADAVQTVSVVIPCYNYAKFVGEAIDSALGQTQLPLEVIVINDGSTDNSMEIIQQYKNRVRIIDQKNSGVVQTKNNGLKEAKGDWIIFLDADDVLEPTYIEESLSLARKHGLDVVYTDMQLFGSTQSYFAAHQHDIRRLREGNYIHNSSLMRTEIVRRVGGYKPKMDHGYEDWELYITLAEAKMKAMPINKPLLNYRQHHKNDSRNIMAISKASDIYKTVYNLHPKTFRRSYFLKKEIKGRLSRLHLLPSKHTMRYWFGKTFITRKIWGFGKLIHRGEASLILPKLQNHFKNLRSKVFNRNSD